MPDEVLRLPGPEPEKNTDEPKTDPTPEETAEAQPRQDATGDHSTSQQGSSSRHIPTGEQCLLQLAQLPGLLMLGYVKPVVANAIRATLRDILQYQTRDDSAAASGNMVNNEMLDKLRDNPEIMNLIEPFLTEAQITALIRSATDGRN